MAIRDDYDLIVVGCGAAGLAAAIAYVRKAREQNRPARVALLEIAPQDQRGGATRWTTSRFRVRRDYSLNPDFVGKMERDSNGRADLDYCRVLERETPATVRFLEEHGLSFFHYDARIAAGVTHEIWPEGGGRAIVEGLVEFLEAAPETEIHYQTEALRLSLDGDGRVDGVVARGGDGLTRTLRGRAVVLACGGFEGNAEMLTRYLGPNACDLKLLAPGLAFNQGAGIRMAMEIGAAMSGQFDMVHTELVDRRTERADAVIYAHPYGIVVNGEGERFFDEGRGTVEETFELIAFEVWKNQKQTAFFIADQTIAGNADLKPLFDTDRPAIEADTIGALAAKLGLDPLRLSKTIADYNAAIGPATFDPTRRDGKRTQGLSPDKSNWAYPLVAPPFFAYPLTAAICFTYGGIRTDSQARVLSGNGAAIPGLYAAGEITGVFYHEYPAGTSVLRGLTFGRIAGIHAAENARANL